MTIPTLRCPVDVATRATLAVLLLVAVGGGCADTVPLSSSDTPAPQHDDGSDDPVDPPPPPPPIGRADAFAPLRHFAAGNDAAVLAHDLPTTLRTGETRTVHITLRNMGSTTWTAAAEYRLGIDDADANTTVGRVELPSGDVSPGGTASFAVDVRAPFEPGAIPLTLRMLEEGVEWFGDAAAVSLQVVVGTCNEPLPPALEDISVVVHNDMGNKKVLDSTPHVHSREYCEAIGFTDGRIRCPIRLEGHEETDECNAYAVGVAPETGRVGPSWTFNDVPCVDGAAPQGCKPHPQNQFLVIVFGSGVARACTQSEHLDPVCGELVIP